MGLSDPASLLLSGAGRLVTYQLTLVGGLLTSALIFLT
jgi:hypothetical protein